MTETPDHKTFNLLEALQGINYPEDYVDVYLDAAVMYRLDKIDTELKKFEILQDAEGIERLEKVREDLVSAAETLRFRFHVQYQPRERRQALFTEVFEEHPEVKDAFGRVQPDTIRDEYFTNREWSLHITRVEDPSGAVQAAPAPEVIEAFRKKAPDPAQVAIQKKIDSLYEGTKAGYEDFIQETSFLSSASTEA